MKAPEGDYQQEPEEADREAGAGPVTAQAIEPENS